MRCGAFVRYEERRRKGSGEPYEKPVQIWSPFHTTDLGVGYAVMGEQVTSTDLLARGFTVCDGEIEVDIRAVDENHWGYSSASLEVSYKCLKCGNTHYPHLPTDNEGQGGGISQFVSWMLTLVNEAAVSKLLSDHKARIEAQEAGVIEARRKLVERQKETKATLAKRKRKA